MERADAEKKQLCVMEENKRTTKLRLANDIASIIADLNSKLESLVHAYGDEEKLKVLASTSQYHHLQQDLSTLTWQIERSREIFLTEASKNEILEIDMTANTQMIVDMEHKLELLTKQYADMRDQYQKCVVQYELFQCIHT